METHSFILGKLMLWPPLSYLFKAKMLQTKILARQQSSKWIRVGLAQILTILEKFPDPFASESRRSRGLARLLRNQQGQKWTLFKSTNLRMRAGDFAPDSAQGKSVTGALNYKSEINICFLFVPKRYTASSPVA